MLCIAIHADVMMTTSWMTINWLTIVLNQTLFVLWERDNVIPVWAVKIMWASCSMEMWPVSHQKITQLRLPPAPPVNKSHEDKDDVRSRSASSLATPPVCGGNQTDRTRVVAYLRGLIVSYLTGYYVLTFHVFRQSVYMYVKMYVYLVKANLETIRVFRDSYIMKCV